MGFEFYRAGVSHGHPKYDYWEPIAKTLKIVIQMIIGLILVILLTSKLFCHVFQYDYPSWLSYIKSIHSLNVLEIVSRALAYSTGIELAYMLFTPGPDEAIEPLITGTASAFLYLVSKEAKLELQTVASMLLFVIVIAVLFFMKDAFINRNEPKKAD